jgi:hypothetical protein
MVALSGSPGDSIDAGGRHCEERLRRSNPSVSAKKRGLLRFARNDG